MPVDTLTTTMHATRDDVRDGDAGELTTAMRSNRDGRDDRSAHAPVDELAPVDTFDRLTLAMLDVDPACKGDDRFTLDRPTNRQQQAMGKLCDSCPVRVLCEAHTAAERPAAGFWAGVSYPLRKHDLDKEDND